MPSKEVAILVRLLGHSLEVVSPGQNARDIYSEEPETFDHFYLGIIIVHRGVCTAS